VGTFASSVIASGLEFSEMGTLYGSFNNLYTLDPSTMATTANLGSTGGFNVSKLTFGNGGTLYGMDIYNSTYIVTLDLYSGYATVATAVGSIGLVSLVAEQSLTTHSTSTQAKFEKESAASSPDIESLIEMENKIKARYIYEK